MKKIYTIIILSILLFGVKQSFAQCSPIFNDGCSIALHSFGLSFSPTSTMLIEDTETACSGPSSSGVINVTAGYTYNFDLNVFSAAGSDNTSAFFSIFLDKNNDGDFEDADERLYYNNSTEIFKSGFGSPDYFSDVITIPADATTGVDLKFRVLVVAANDLGAGCNTDPSDACGTYCGGEIHDYTLNIAPVPICPLIFINGCSIALHNFSLASVTPTVTLINNIETSCSGPEGNPIINVKAGENYNFDLTVNSAGGSDNVSAFFSIWLDKNNDGDFADSGERLYYNNTTQIYKSGYGPPENASGSITIPTDALTGIDLKFRVLVVAANDLGDGCNTDPNNACGMYCGGEVHDYLFNITPPDCITPNTPTVSDVTACAGSNVTLTATCATGTPSWYESSTAIAAFNSGSLTINNVTAPGITYYVACETSETCASNRVTQSTIVTEIPSLPTATGQTICSGATASLTANCTTGTAKWYKSNTSTTVLGSGTYTTPILTTSTTYFVACESGGVQNCVSARTAQMVTVNDLPNPPTATGQTICSGVTASLTANCTTGTAKWYESNTSTTVLGTENYTTPSLTTATTYFVACESGGSPNCVSSRTTQTVNVNPLPTIPVISSSQTIICTNESAYLTASGCNGQIYWNNGETTITIRVFDGGTYSATCSNNCGIVNSSNNAIITKAFYPRTPTIALTSPILCGETTKTLIATGCNGQIKWNTNSTGSSLTITTAGTYTAICETICGSSPRGNILNVQFLPNPAPTATNTGPYEIGQKIQLSATGGNTYLWRGPNDFLSTNANVSILNAALDDRGIYTVTVTNTVGCTATATSNVVVNPCSQMFKYDYVKAGTNFEYFFPITDGMTINAMSINTGIIATPICQLDTINTPSVRLQMTGPEPLYNRDIIENIYPYSPFENRWFQIFGPIFPVGEYTLTVTGYSQEYAQGNVMFGPQTIHFTIVGNSTSITMAQNNISEICAGSSFDISFESTGDFLNGNIFEVQLSNANGSFEVPIKIGESNNAGIVNCQIPTNIPAGNGYKTRVFATKPAQMSNSSSLGFKINPRNISLQSPSDDISALVNKKAGEKITATNKVQTTANATFQAGRSIHLEVGFSVNVGAVFKAEIGACN